MEDPSMMELRKISSCDKRGWTQEAVRLIEADRMRSSDTHLILHALEGAPGITLYLKDESSHPTGSLKHRLARSLFLYALCNNWIGPESTVIEASSGSTAVSEAYFAKLLGLRFIAVMPRTVAPQKTAAIRFQGGDIHFVEEPGQVYAEAARLAQESGGHYMDQFTYAERATDWRGNNNIAESMFHQFSCEPKTEPDWIVCGAGTGGTSATFGRYIRYQRFATRLCVADPERSVFHRHFRDRSVKTKEAGSENSCIEGIGRPRVEPSFIPEVVDRMIAVSDAESIAATRLISERLGRRCGGSTGTNIWACSILTAEMLACGTSGSIATILCDSGDRYAETYFSDDWLAKCKIDWQPQYVRLKRFFETGRLE
jgi:cysteine synthase